MRKKIALFDQAQSK